MKASIEVLEYWLKNKANDKSVLENRIQDLDEKITGAKMDLNKLVRDMDEITKAIGLLKVAGES